MDTVTVVVARDVGAGAAEDQVAAVGALRAIRQAEEIRAATDDVVLAEIAEDHIVAAVALDVVVAVAWRFERRAEIEQTVCAAVGSDETQRGIGKRQHAGRADHVQRAAMRDRAVALDDVVAELAEDLIVARAAGDVVVAEVVGSRGLGRGVEIEELDVETLPERRAARDVLARN